MLKINEQQMLRFAESRIRGFEERMVHHLGELFPLRCAAMGASSLRSMVQGGIRRATSHGLTVEKDVCLFICAMCALGEGVDVDAHSPWVMQVLGKESPGTTSEKVERLCELASERLSQAGDGPQDEAMELQASTALAEAPRRAAQAQFCNRSPVERPIIPCPRKRGYLFSV
ncbi:hypothetical protein [Cystobacter fuscus]|uniref:hypothetical protein n=1 Tax=Cystobacter fuscus TaxID=43 RepID=UPI0005BAD947|nr:hypothetical protein [Cystobacter fuscus]